MPLRHCLYTGNFSLLFVSCASVSTGLVLAMSSGWRTKRERDSPIQTAQLPRTDQSRAHSEQKPTNVSSVVSLDTCPGTAMHLKLRLHAPHAMCSVTRLRTALRIRTSSHRGRHRSLQKPQHQLAPTPKDPIQPRFLPSHPMQPKPLLVPLLVRLPPLHPSNLPRDSQLQGRQRVCRT